MATRHALGIASLWRTTALSSGGGGGGGYSGQTVIFGIAGQSNAIGRDGPVDGVLDATDADILMWDSVGTSFVTAQDPLDHFDETADTVGYGLSFAKAFKAAYSPARIILVGMAEGGTGFIAGDWSPGVRAASTYVNAKARWEAAYAQAVTDYGSVVVGGLLWSQGEDEVASYGTLFDTLADVPKFRAMPQGLFETMRAVWSGWSADTPVLVTSIPSGSAYTGNLAYDEVQQALSEIPTYTHRTGFVDGADLTESDTQHWDAESQRTMGARLAAAFPTAILNDVAYTTSTFTEDAANVETAILFDPRPVGSDDLPLVNEGTFKEFDNKRVNISGNALVFDGSAELRWLGDSTQKPRLAARDFKISMSIALTSAVTEQGIFSDWQAVTGQRSFVVRYLTGDLEFYGSNDGSTSTLLLTCPWDRSSAEFVIERVGTSMSLLKDGVEVDTYTGAFTFWDSGDTRALHLGDHQNAKEMGGTIDYFALEFLS